MSNATARDVMRYAIKQYGYTESPAGSNKTKFGKEFGLNGQPWCFIFEWACGENAKGTNPFPHNANAAYGQDEIVSKKGGKWVMKKTSSNATKKAGLSKVKFGDCIDFDFGKNNLYRQHTALAIGVSGEYYICIEGNTSTTDKGSQSNGGCVAIRKRHYKQVCSIARPKYGTSKKYAPTTSFLGTIPSLPKKGYIARKDSGTQVQRLQAALNWADGSGLTVDGEFGNNTLAAVILFQVANGLTPDGEFGKKSMEKLKIIIASCKTSQKPTSPVQTDKKEDAKENVTKEETTVKTAYIPKQGAKCYDLSDHQGALSKAYFTDIKTKGVECVILRSSYTKCAKFNMNVDAHFVNNIENAIAAGMHIGVYHYSAAITAKEAKQEAEFCLKTIAPYCGHIDLPVAFDCEFGVTTKDGSPRFTAKVAKALGKTEMGKVVDAFMAPVKAAGYDVMLYANLTMFNNYFPANIHNSYKIWIAQYNKTCDYNHPYYMWQFTSNNGTLDESYFGTQGAKASETPVSKECYQKGDTGDGVKKLQELLNKKNKGSILKELVIDGDFGTATLAHVKLFQDVRKLTQDGIAGEKTLAKLESCSISNTWKAINWAVSVARDNSFAYGTGARAHHNGCYFCGTNINGPKKAKKGSQWEKTYCCNPFVHAAYAHGVGDATMLKACKQKKAAGLVVGDWTKFGFKNIGLCKKIKFEDLKAGDVLLLKNSHVCMYTGGNYIVEASGGTFGANSIAHKKTAKSRYKTYQGKTAYVLRYSK